MRTGQRFFRILLLTATGALCIGLLWLPPAHIQGEGGTTPTPAATLIPAGMANTAWTPVEREINGIPMVFVPAGCFEMGSAQADVMAWNEQNGSTWFNNELPSHEVCITASFWMSKFEITNADFRRFRDAGGYSTRDYWSQEGWDYIHFQPSIPESFCRRWSNLATQPWICMSWYEAAAFARWAGGRLPTEAEWEYAARGPESLLYPWGNTFDGKRLNFCDSNCEHEIIRDSTVDDGHRYTAPVGSYPDGASWTGALDMSGNVREWVADWFDKDYFVISPRDDPQGPAESSHRSARDSAWDYYAIYARTASRDGLTPISVINSLGVRIVVEDRLGGK